MKFLVAFLALCGSAAFAAPTVDDKVYLDLESAGVSTVILHFKADHKQVLNNYISEFKPQERSVDSAVLDNILFNHANEQQASTLSLLNARKVAKASGSSFSQLWSINKLVVKDVDAELLELLKSNEDIKHIEADQIHQLIDFGAIRVEEDQVNAGEAWGVVKVQAPEAWAAGFDGRGVVVGVIDTGFYAQHNKLSSRFRSEFGWEDQVNGRADPYDDQGHGTHCAGSIAGTGGIGVAPGAQLIACKALDSRGSGSTSGLLACGQFMACPSNNPNNCMSPNVVSNSWGSTAPGNAFYNDVIDTWRMKNIVGVFANGNSGSSCSTTGSPAYYSNALAVGATDSSDKVASFSSRGPALGIMKPEVSAPGVNVVSAGITGPDASATMSGTSMATPHVAGVAALLKQQDMDAHQDDIRKKLEGSAENTTPGNPVASCGGVSETEYPNNHVGHGRVNALKSLGF